MASMTRFLVTLVLSVAWLPCCPAPPVVYNDEDLADIFGDECGYPMGSSLHHNQFTASSWLPGNEPSMARFNKGLSGWRAEFNDTEQWIEVRLPSKIPVTAILTQGHSDLDMYVTHYKVKHSLDKDTWMCLLDMHSQAKVYEGNTDHSTPKIVDFHPAVEANFIRIIPYKWHNAISMRFEIFSGCEDCLQNENQK